MWAGRPASASWAGNWAHPTGPSTGLGPGAWSASPPRTPSSPSRPRARGRAGSRVSSWPLGGDRPGLGRGRGAGRPATGSGSATVCGVRLGRRPGVRAEGRVGRGMTPFAGTARARQSPGWVRAPVPRPEPAPGHTEAWAPRHARDAAKAGDPGAGPPDSPPGWKRRLWEGVTATPTDAPGRPLTGLAGAHAHSRTGGRAARCAPRPPPPPLRPRHQTRALCSGEEGAPLDPQVCSPSPRPPGSLLCRPLGALAVSGRPLTSWERFESLREADGKGGRLLASRHPSLGPWPSAPASLPSRSPVPGLVPWTAGERWRCYL